MTSSATSGTRTLLVLLALLGALRALFPGDVPFIADEPLIVERALDALDEGRFVVSGLQGTRGAVYGPVPTWFYQAALSVTSDLRVVAVVKIVVVTGLSGLALVMLAGRLPGLSAPLGAFAFLSPYLWFYARDLWDNSFSIPFTAMLVATYVAFDASGRARYLSAAALFAILCVLTHFMTAPLVGAVLVHFAVRRRRELLGSPAFAARVTAIGLVSLAVTLPYLTRLSAGSAADFLWSPSPPSLAFSLDGFRIFTLVGFDYVIGAWRAGGAGPVIRLVSAFTYVVGAYGLFLLNRRLRDGSPWASVGSDGVPAPGDPASTVAGVAALALVLFVVVVNGKRLFEHPHYYNGVWIVFFLLWWTGMSALWRHAWARRALMGQLTVMAVFLPALVVQLHTSRGTKSLHYGPTLDNQMAVARELERLGVDGVPPSAAHHPRLFPQALTVLRRLEVRRGAVEGGPGADAGGYEIVYEDPDGRGGAIVLRRVPSGGDPPVR